MEVSLPEDLRPHLAASIQWMALQYPLINESTPGVTMLTVYKTREFHHLASERAGEDLEMCCAVLCCVINKDPFRHSRNQDCFGEIACVSTIPVSQEEDPHLRVWIVSLKGIAQLARTLTSKERSNQRSITPLGGLKVGP
jgi:hypothetical protein